MKYYSALKRTKYNAICSNMDGETVRLSKIKQKDNFDDITYMWNLKNGTNEFIYKKEIESQM